MDLNTIIDTIKTYNEKGITINPAVIVYDRVKQIINFISRHIGGATVLIKKLLI